MGGLICSTVRTLVFLALPYTLLDDLRGLRMRVTAGVLTGFRHAVLDTTEPKSAPAGRWPGCKGRIGPK